MREMTTSVKWRILLLLVLLAGGLLGGVVANEMKRRAAAEKELLESQQRQTPFHKINAYLKDSLLAGWESTKSLFVEPEEPEPANTTIEVMWATACDSIELSRKYMSEMLMGKPKEEEKPSALDALRSWMSVTVFRQEPPVVEKTKWEAAVDAVTDVWQSEQVIALRTAFADVREFEYCGVSTFECLTAVVTLGLLLSRCTLCLRIMKGLRSFAMNRLKLKVPVSFVSGIGRAIAKVSCDTIRLVRYKLQPSAAQAVTEASSVTQMEFEKLKETSKAEIAEFEKRLDNIQDHLRNRFDKIEDILEATPQMFEDLEKLKDQVDQDQQKHDDGLVELLRHMGRMETCVTGVQEVVEGDRGWIKEKESFFGGLATELKRRAVGQDPEPVDPYPDIPLPESFVTQTVSQSPSVRTPSPPPTPVSEIPPPKPVAKPVPRKIQRQIPRPTVRPNSQIVRPIVIRPITTAPVRACPSPAATKPAQSPVAAPRKRQLKTPKSYVREINMKKKLKA